MGTITNNTANAAINAGATTTAILADLAKGRIVIRNENRNMLMELFGEALALPNPPLNVYLPCGKPIATGWSPSLRTLSTFFYASTRLSMGETPEARREAKRLALALIMDYIPYGIVVHGTRDADGDLDNVIINFKSTLAATRDTLVTQLSTVDTTEVEKFVKLDKISFYDFDRRGHWKGEHFLPSSPTEPTAQLTMAD